MLETERLLLRRWKPSDRAPFAGINADPRVMEFLGAPLDRGQSDALIDRAEEHFRNHGFGPYAVELRESGEFIGFVALMIPSFEAHFTPCLEIGWRLAADVWGRGYATEGAGALMDHAFREIGLRELVSFTAATNFRSRRVMH
ncbi:MAG TPA: GNAT family N-acetyltransferase, partial [Bryobacteraceae bacterium]|nr:GNAT family N-acetyltransferase [Bryobacteraceae bacterium]